MRTVRSPRELLYYEEDQDTAGVIFTPVARIDGGRKPAQFLDQHFVLSSDWGAI